MCENSNDTVMKTSSITLHTVLVAAAILLSAAMSSCSNDKNRASTRDDRSMAQRAYNLGIEDANNIQNRPYASVCSTSEQKPPTSKAAYPKTRHTNTSAVSNTRWNNTATPSHPPSSTDPQSPICTSPPILPLLHIKIVKNIFDCSVFIVAL